MKSKLPEDWEEVRLAEVANYLNDKVTIDKCEIDKYISTTNMIENKGGIIVSDSLPKAKSVNSFKKGDILISNIRPYFKKIWFATFDGTSSTDVLIFRGNKNIYNKYLYYVLSNDYFFDYTTKSSKGTKMPRGDKKAIMDYLVPELSFKEQKVISDTLSALDDKIELNNKINENLEQQAQAIFKHWFIDFEFPDENGKPYKSSGGEMVESELGMIPKGWEIYEMDRICERIRPGTNYQPKRVEDGIPFLNIRNINAGYIDCSDAKFISKEDYEKVHSSWVPEKNDVLISRIGTLGLVAVIKEKDLPIAVHYNFIDMKAKSISYQLLYFILKSDFFQQEYHMIKKASVQDYVTINEVKELKVFLPTNNELLLDLQMIFNSFFNKIDTLQIENTKLSNLRDTLLPKLMSGEIRIPLD